MTVKQLDASLMLDFIQESNDPGSVKLDIDLPISDEPSLAALQVQGLMSSLRSKQFMLTDIFDSNSETGKAVARLKKIMIRNYMTSPAMKFLYDLDDIELLAQQISMLSIAFRLMDVDDIYNVDRKYVSQSLDPDLVGVPMGIYNYFTILNNPNMTPKMFNELYVRSWYNYYENWMVRIPMFQMAGNNWKNSFKGVLLSKI